MTRFTLRATVVTGLGEASTFTDLPWVREQLRIKLNLDIHSGTLNARPADEPARAQWRAWRRQPGVLLSPLEPEACTACCHPIWLQGDIRGAIIVPHVPGYPEDQIEVVAQVHLRTVLDLHDGDVIMIRAVAVER